MWLNALDPKPDVVIAVNLVKSNVARLEHPINAFAPILVRLAGYEKLTVVRLEHPKKQSIGRLETLPSIVTLVRLLQFLNGPVAGRPVVEVIVLGRVMEVSPDSSNAEPLILVTLEGMVML